MEDLLYQELNDGDLITIIGYGWGVIGVCVVCGETPSGQVRHISAHPLWTAWNAKTKEEQIRTGEYEIVKNYNKVHKVLKITEEQMRIIVRREENTGGDELEYEESYINKILELSQELRE